MFHAQVGTTGERQRGATKVSQRIFQGALIVLGLRGRETGSFSHLLKLLNRSHGSLNVVADEILGSKPRVLIQTKHIHSAKISSQRGPYQMQHAAYVTRVGRLLQLQHVGLNDLWIVVRLNGFERLFPVIVAL